MAIDSDLVVTIDEGKVYFTSPGLNEWAVILQMDNKPVEEQADILAAKVEKVENLYRKNGELVTVESLKEKNFPVSFFFLLKKRWIEAVIDSAKGDGNGKNA